MKTLFAILLLLVSFGSFAQPVQVSIRPLQDYYFFRREELEEGVNCRVLTSRKEMEKMFGKTTRPDTPDFSKELMLVMVMPATKKDLKLSYEYVSMRAGEFIEVYCDLKLRGHTLTYEFNPIAVAVIPRSERTREVRFYDNKTSRLIDRVPIKERL